MQSVLCSLSAHDPSTNYANRSGSFPKIEYPAMPIRIDTTLLAPADVAAQIVDRLELPSIESAPSASETTKGRDEVA